MTLQVYKLDDRNSRQIILVKDSNDNHYFPANVPSISPITISGTGTFSTLNLSSYDAELHLGIVANDSTDATAAANTVKLSGALNAMWLGGTFTFADGTVGPILKPITFAGKGYHFKNTIPTSTRIGTQIYGVGKGYEASIAAYATDGFQGGSVTRFYKTNPEDGKPLLRVRGPCCHIAGIEFFGAEFVLGGAGSVTGTKATSLIEIEARPFVTCGRNLIENCGLYEAQTGIGILAGYYSGTTFISYENNADQTVVNNIECSALNSCFRCNNNQATWWNFHNIIVNDFGYGEETVIFDWNRGGNLNVMNVQMTHQKITLLKVKDAGAPNGNRININNVEWDHSTSDPLSYLTLFCYTGANTSDGSNLKWAVRVNGHMNNPSTIYNTGMLIRIPTGVINFPKTDILFDITNLPTGGGYFTTSYGPWKYPS
jgi:hypothetical protein